MIGFLGVEQAVVVEVVGRVLKVVSPLFVRLRGTPKRLVSLSHWTANGEKPLAVASSGQEWTTAVTTAGMSGRGVGPHLGAIDGWPVAASALVDTSPASMKTAAIIRRAKPPSIQLRRRVGFGESGDISIGYDMA